MPKPLLMFEVWTSDDETFWLAVELATTPKGSFQANLGACIAKGVCDNSNPSNHNCSRRATASKPFVRIYRRTLGVGETMTTRESPKFPKTLGTTALPQGHRPYRSSSTLAIMLRFTFSEQPMRVTQGFHNSKYLRPRSGPQRALGPTVRKPHKGKLGE